MRWLRYHGRLSEGLDAPTAERLENTVPGLSTLNARIRSGPGWGRSGPRVSVPYHAFELARSAFEAQRLHVTWDLGWADSKTLRTPADYPRTIEARQRYLGHQPELKPSITLFPHQIAALQAYTATGAQLFDWFTGSGKTLTAIVASMLHRVHWTGRPHRVIVVTNANLVAQWYDAFDAALVPSAPRPVCITTETQYAVQPASDRQREHGVDEWTVFDKLVKRPVASFEEASIWEIPIFSLFRKMRCVPYGVVVLR
jgi:hypothetical protein